MDGGPRPARVPGPRRGIGPRETTPRGGIRRRLGACRVELAARPGQVPAKRLHWGASFRAGRGPTRRQARPSRVPRSPAKRRARARTRRSHGLPLYEAPRPRVPPTPFPNWARSLSSESATTGQHQPTRIDPAAARKPPPASHAAAVCSLRAACRATTHFRDRRSAEPELRCSRPVGGIPSRAGGGSNGTGFEAGTSRPTRIRGLADAAETEWAFRCVRACCVPDGV